MFDIMIDIINFMDKITIVVSFATLFFVLKNYFKNKKQLEKIKIVFSHSDKDILVDNNLLRKDCQRSEIQGILRTKLKKGIGHYDIDYIGSKEYFDNLYEVQIGNSNKLTIYLKDDEANQFNIKSF